MIQILSYDMDLEITVNCYEATVPVTVHYIHNPIIAGNTVDQEEWAHVEVQEILLRGTSDDQEGANPHLRWLIGNYLPVDAIKEIEAEILEANHGEG